MIWLQKNYLMSKLSKLSTITVIVIRFQDQLADCLFLVASSPYQLHLIQVELFLL